jgi:hypothetical protein
LHFLRGKRGAVIAAVTPHFILHAPPSDIMGAAHFWKDPPTKTPPSGSAS